MKVETSEFIDCPAGDINLLVKSITTGNTAIFNENTVLEVDLLSKVSRNKVLNYSEFSSPDHQKSQAFANYSLKDKEDELKKILMAHVVNLVTRHVEDRIVLRIRGKEGKIITQTEFEISSLQLKHN